MKRREMLKMTASTIAGASILGLPLPAEGQSLSAGKRRKVLVIGAHPDDPETACGGTICLLTDAGHEVVCVYLTRGEAGIQGLSHSEAAAVRMKESEAACAVTGARYVFMSQTDGNTEANLARYAEMRELLKRENPDLVITHWPIDGHRDHAICGILVLDAWRRLDRRFDLYYFEVMTGTQTQMFNPSHWVDIEAVRSRKYEACRCHKSQDMEPLLREWHGPMETFRGMECRCGAAEAFARHIESQSTL